MISTKFSDLPKPPSSPFFHCLTYRLRFFSPRGGGRYVGPFFGSAHPLLTVVRIKFPLRPLRLVVSCARLFSTCSIDSHSKCTVYNLSLNCHLTKNISLKPPPKKCSPREREAVTRDTSRKREEEKIITASVGISRGRFTHTHAHARAHRAFPNIIRTVGRSRRPIVAKASENEKAPSDYSTSHH